MLDGSQRAARSRHSTLLQITDPKNVRSKNEPRKPARPVSEYFGELTFNMSHMRDKLPREDRKSVV